MPYSALADFLNKIIKPSSNFHCFEYASQLKVTYSLPKKNMNKLKFIVTIFLPVLALALFDKNGMVFFAGPVFVILAAILTSIFLSITKKCVVKASKRYSIALCISIAYFLYFSFETYDTYTPEGRFGCYFKMEPPLSVTNLEVNGAIYMTGGRLTINFDVSPEDCERLVKSIALKQVSEQELISKAEYKGIQDSEFMNKFPEQTIYLDSEFEGTSYRMLIVNEDRTKIRFTRFRI